VPGKHRNAQDGGSPAPIELGTSSGLDAPRNAGHRAAHAGSVAATGPGMRRFLPLGAAFGAILIILLAGLSLFGLPGTGNGAPTSVADRTLADRGSRDLDRASASASTTASPIGSPTGSPSPTTAGSPTAKPTTPKPSATTPKVVSTGTCEASFYGDGQNTASGERFDPSALTAAHKTLPFNTRVRVTNLKNGKSVVVRINDRGPFVSGRCLDLSTAAFGQIASLSSGVAQVRYEVLK